VVGVAATVENDGGDTGGLCALGGKLADLLRYLNERILRKAGKTGKK